MAGEKISLMCTHFIHSVPAEKSEIGSQCLFSVSCTKWCLGYRYTLHLTFGSA